MPVLEEPQIYTEFDTKLCEWGTSQAVRIPKAASRATRNVCIGTSFHAEVGSDAEGDYILLRPQASTGGSLKLGLALEMGLVRPWDEEAFEALDAEIESMFEDIG